jgi:hypothetical protein
MASYYLVSNVFLHILEDQLNGQQSELIAMSASQENFINPSDEYQAGEMYVEAINAEMSTKSVLVDKMQQLSQQSETEEDNFW